MYALTQLTIGLSNMCLEVYEQPSADSDSVYVANLVCIVQLEISVGHTRTYSAV